MHLLLTPTEPGATSRMMRVNRRRNVVYFNARYRRTGTLWEGLFNSALVNNEPSHNAHGGYNPSITPQSIHLALARAPVARQAAYQTVFETIPPPEEAESLSLHSQQ